VVLAETEFCIYCPHSQPRFRYTFNTELIMVHWHLYWQHYAHCNEAVSWLKLQSEQDPQPLRWDFVHSWSVPGSDLAPETGCPAWVSFISPARHRNCASG
jgi:hypothetical protein